MARLFGTDGVRGNANTELTPELAFRLGWAAAWYFGREHEKPAFLIGRDTRISGQMLEAALCAGICSAGGEAVVLGVIPTPGVAWLTSTSDAVAGVVISASHNPFADNGIKFFSGTGYKLPDAVEDDLEEIVARGMETLPRPTGKGVGAITYRHDRMIAYQDFLCSTIKENLSGLRVVIDCANGASFETAPAVLSQLGIDLCVLHAAPDGININDHCGSTHMESLKSAVLAQKADLGLAFDGDADRCLAIDEKGQMVDGDQIMVILAKELLRNNALNQTTLVTTVMSNIGLHQAIRKAGGNVMITAVGDRYVLEAMQKNGLSLGGEQSGHIIFGEYSTTGDGLMTAIQLLAAVKRSGLPLSHLGELMTRFPQVLVNVRVHSKAGWEENPRIVKAVKSAEQTLGEDGRILVRASGTEPLIRVMAEGPVLEELERLAETVAQTIRTELN
ncbi:MAG TPA: phosphoglucosamine mutase [Negativicutes bacterium]|nr:phosphoglucosamine mutase [Negativicutes bacterium]